MSLSRATSRLPFSQGGGARIRSGFWTLSLAIGLVVPVAVAHRAGAATTINVNTTVDELNAGGNCSLREAVRAANLDTPVGGCPAGSGVDTIVVPAGTYRLTRIGAQEQAAVLGDLDILQSVTINGAGSGATILDGNGTERILDVFGGVTATVNGVAIQNGKPANGRRGGGIVLLDTGSLTLRNSVVRNNRTADGVDHINDGGGIYNDGTMTLVNTVVSDNVAGGNEGSGGGIWNSGTLTVTSSTVRNNTANGSNAVMFPIDGGGGIYNEGTLTVSLSTVSGNISKYRGGGIASTTTASVVRSTISGNRAATGGGLFITGTSTTVINSTLSGNLAFGHGGGVSSGATTTTIANTTLAVNTADRDANGSGDGGGVYVSAGRVNIRNSLADGNIDSGGQAPGCKVAAGAFFSQGYNHFGGTTGCVITGPGTGDQIGGSAMIGALANNGGPTLTHALLPGSPAIDAANPAAPGSGGTSCATLDQRGTARPQDGNGDTVFRCDMGAYERTP